ncbi:restriction endonuclease subunit S [Malonomonas rubra]|uniref:restriction endonuclease subunit S n=1 Tax=Malonomonas rubra TaxID=57040 RepID=UPI00137AF8A0|nr:restriction endonuclease subunit S [Malonomonas rubra]
MKWLGDIPSEWKICAIKHVSTLNPAKSKLRYQQGDECSFVPMEKLKTDSLVLDEIRPIADVYEGYTYFVDDDILMAKVTPCFENKNIAIAKDMVNGVGFGSSEIYVLRSNQKANNRYLFYRLQDDGFMEVATSSMSGAGGLKRVPSDVLNNFLVALPEYEEQIQIANFLDHETAKIDSLIDKQQQLITLLKEKRQAVISHAVTKGLNPDAPLKDSGVEWLGEMPEHWEEVRVKRLYKFAKRQGYKDLTVLSVYREHGVIVKSTRDDNFNKTPENLSVYQLVNKGDLAINKMKAWQGSMGISQHQGITSPDYAVYRPLHDFADRYLHYWFRASHMPDVYRNISTGIRPSQWRLDLEEFEKLKVFLPPSTERSSIVREINAIEMKYLRLVELAEKQIDLLQERRTALISAAVTGKIDVRNWKPERR